MLVRKRACPTSLRVARPLTTAHYSTPFRFVVKDPFKPNCSDHPEKPKKIADTFPSFCVYSNQQFTRQRVDREADLVVGVERTRPCETAPKPRSAATGRRSLLKTRSSSRTWSGISSPTISILTT